MTRRTVLAGWSHSPTNTQYDPMVRTPPTKLSSRYTGIIPQLISSMFALLFKGPLLAIVHLSILIPGNIEVRRSIASTAHHFTFMMIRCDLPCIGDEQRCSWMASKISSGPIKHACWRHNMLLKIRGHDRRAMAPPMPYDGNMVYSMDFRSASTFWKVMVLRAVSGSSLS